MTKKEKIIAGVIRAPAKDTANKPQDGLRMQKMRSVVVTVRDSARASKISALNKKLSGQYKVSSNTSSSGE